MHVASVVQPAWKPLHLGPYAWAEDANESRGAFVCHKEFAVPVRALRYVGGAIVG